MLQTGRGLRYCQHPDVTTFGCRQTRGQLTCRLQNKGLNNGIAVMSFTERIKRAVLDELMSIASGGALL